MVRRFTVCSCSACSAPRSSRHRYRIVDNSKLAKVIKPTIQNFIRKQPSSSARISEYRPILGLLGSVLCIEFCCRLKRCPATSNAKTSYFGFSHYMSVLKTSWAKLRQAFLGASADLLERGMGLSAGFIYVLRASPCTSRSKYMSHLIVPKMDGKL